MLEFAYPVRPYSRFYIAATFLDPGYVFSGKLRHHKGIDLNLKTGGDTDLGYPVQSMFPGVVKYAQHSGSWGGIVMVRTHSWFTAHIKRHYPELGGVPADVQYAHLHQITVREGQVISAGDHVGSIGKGGHSQYLAHLHLEVRKVWLPATDPQGSTPEALKHVKTNYLDPERVMGMLRFSDFGNIHPVRKLLFPADGVGIDNEWLPGEQTVVTNVVNRKFFVRTGD